MKKLNFLFGLFLIFITVFCSEGIQGDITQKLPDDAGSIKSSRMKLKIAVVSDIHFMDPSLLPDDVANNPYFQGYLAKDPKLIELSDPIFRQVVSELITEKPDILLIPGDLTKDGELMNHESVKNLLQQLADVNIKVFVVPGNHDINNPEAMSFKGGSPSPVSSVTPRDFASIYGNFGYNDALYRDENSLSYICQPFENLWILAIDACKYTENIGTSDVSGAIRPATLAWIQGKLKEARENGITVLTMMHHGIMEHYTGQNILDPGYVIDNGPEAVTALMNEGVKLIFTGHYHANDITEYTSDGKTLTDVETGSLVTPLSPYRIMTLDDNYIKIETRQVTTIDAPLPVGMDFLTYSNLFLSAHLDGYFTYVLMNNYKIPEELAGIAAPFLSKASMAHFAGDERITPEERKNLDELSQIAPLFLVGALNSFWTDLPPSDGEVHIRLK